MAKHLENVIPIFKDTPLPENETSHSGGNGGGGEMETRVKKLEEYVHSIKVDLAVIKSNYATKEDIASVRVEVQKAIANQTKWIAATLIATASIAIAVSKLIF
ncbi:hypothetical protein [Xenorhabdus bovienii]|uniref:Hemolysin XhlA n=1 Tax=Xenorhabdus bovienii (strain SS-2004) TaxID=406818 RepID=D3UXJ4_XENBS|nr:hypothetical protein [Xenorhabdus bovienii]CBJ80369.1 conserved hypothetical protein [Xenorhabdus bovienii SS-2004]CDH29382.1 conserved hypothetical protein [Xenorhabdus bovienii str. Jollieti]